MNGRLPRPPPRRLTPPDIRLQGPSDGVDAATRIFSELGVRSLFVTAHDDAETRARAAGASPLSWLTKPVPPRALLAAIAAVP